MNFLFPPALTRETAALRLLLVVLAAFSVGTFVSLGAHGFISDSEIWAVTLATHFTEEWRHPWVLSRSLFYGGLAPFVAAGTDSVSIFSIAKAVCIANGFLILFLLFRVARSIADAAESTASLIPWLATLVLVSNTGFLNQGYRIRPDLLACSLVLFALERTVRVERLGGPRSTRERSWSALLWLLPLGATPKAILQIIPASFFANSLNPLRGTGRKLGLIASSVALCALLAAVPIYSGSLKYFLASFSREGATSLYSAYLSRPSFVFLIRIISKNWIFGGALLVRGVFLAIRFKVNAFRTPAERRIHAQFFGFCALDVAIALLAPERYPFFLAALLAPLAVFTSLLIEDAWMLRSFMTQAVGTKVVRPFGILLAFVALILAVEVKREAEIYSLEDPDRDEMTMIRSLESYALTYPKAVFYDVIGLLPRRASLRSFAGPNDSGANEAAITMLEKDPPGLIFYTNKCVFLEPRLGSLLKMKYTPLTQGAFGLWQDLDPPLPLTRKNMPRILEELERAAASVGARGLEMVRLETVSLHGSRSVLDIRPKELANLFSHNVRITRISPFTALVDPPPFQINQIFRFDNEY